jgi:hypothetical protein
MVMVLGAGLCLVVGGEGRCGYMWAAWKIGKFFCFW